LNLAKRKISVIIAIVCVIAIVIFLVTDIITSTDVSSSIAAILVAGIIGSLVWGFKPQKFDERSSTEKQEFRTNNTDKSNTKIEKQPSKIQHKSVKLRVDEWDERKLNLKRGTKITGKISSEGFFNVYFLTESSYRSFKNEYNFNYLEGAEEVSHFEPNFEVSRRGDYYFVIQNKYKKNIVVNVELYSN